VNGIRFIDSHSSHLDFVFWPAGSFLDRSEKTLKREQYFSMMDTALINVRKMAQNKLFHGTNVMAQVASWTYPNASSWPFVWIPGYWDIVKEVAPTSIYAGVNFAPLVQPNQVQAFEDFAYAHFAEEFGPNSTMGAQSHFGKGIWGTFRAVKVPEDCLLQHVNLHFVFHFSFQSWTLQSIQSTIVIMIPLVSPSMGLPTKSLHRNYNMAIMNHRGL